ncbi:hypothetical protein [Streptomyces sp. enrichment culture]|uniref:hypothetical protein n=1 Tax=Streptomyces sp. enrichment culture TaxID=1795815 RepID=UPI003F577515
MGMKGKIALGAVVGFAVIAAVSANAGDDGGSGSTGSGKDSSASAEHKPGDRKGTGEAAGQEPAEKEATVGGSGEYQVGSDIRPGTYRSTGNSDGLCYWERAKDASGEVDSLLANDNVTGTAYVTLKPTDKLFTSSDCADWEAVDPKAEGGTPAAEMAGDGGMFKVGVDIAPGTYRSTGNADDMCYWERTKDAEHSMDSIIANNNVSGTAVVTISASDAYFKTSGCKDWKKS